jgi:hypothetical protein
MGRWCECLTHIFRWLTGSQGAHALSTSSPENIVGHPIFRDPTARGLLEAVGSSPHYSRTLIADACSGPNGCLV